MLVVCFLFGVGFYLYKDKVPHNARIAGATAVVAGLLVTAVPYGEYVAPIFVSYLTVYLGLLSPRRTFFVEGADYSYGLFLYGYPNSAGVGGNFARVSFMGAELRRHHCARARVC